MLTGQQIGPFEVEKEIGSGAMGSVYLARYTKTGQRVALKLVSLALSGNEQALARFDREANILKQLRHPNIVRLFGTGRHKSVPYYAMEFIEGESMDKTLERRGRLTWEEVVRLGQQLCSALQHAHEKGIIHRDLKPSNLMLLSDGTLKLTDFGIAKDIDVTQLTSANCTVGTAAYMSPEQCRGEKNLTFKSDLYSLGVLMYELLTGQKPFTADTPMDMFIQHLNGTFTRPSRLVQQLPPWLDTLICQLMEKKPEHRPRDAELVARELQRVEDKAVAQESVGAEVAKRRKIDRPRGAAKLDETDKEAARTIREGLTGKRRKKKTKPFYERGWFQGVGLLGLLALLIGVLVWVFQPPGADVLYGKAETLWKKGNDDARYEARYGPIKEYLQRYGDRDHEQTRQIKAWALEYDQKNTRRALKLMLDTRRGTATIKREPGSDVEQEILTAAWGEEKALEDDDANLVKLAQDWRELAQTTSPDPSRQAWAVLAREYLQRHELAEKIEGKIDIFSKRGGQDYKMETETEKLAEDAIQLEMQAAHAERIDQAPDKALALRQQALKEWKTLRGKFAKDDGQRALVLLALRRIQQLNKLTQGGGPS